MCVCVCVDGWIDLLCVCVCVCLAATLERTKVLEHLDSQTTIVYNLHKKVFPAAQRDSCFLMHIRRLDGNRFGGVGVACWVSPSQTPYCLWLPRSWMAMTESISHDQAPEKYVRIKASVTMVSIRTSRAVGRARFQRVCRRVQVAETVFAPGASPRSRENMTTKLVYMAYVNPGGWAPASVVKAVSKREYPKVLRSLARHAQKFYQTKPIAH